MPFMNSKDAPTGKLATVYVTVDGKRKAMLNAKNVEATANIETKEIPRLGALGKGRKAIGLEISITMTIYKCTSLFDDMVTQFKNTGVLPTFDVQITNEDKAASIGRDSKIYTDCVLDGNVLLNLVDAEGEIVEQEITMYASDYSVAEKYTDPDFM